MKTTRKHGRTRTGTDGHGRVRMVWVMSLALALAGVLATAGGCIVYRPNIVAPISLTEEGQTVEAFPFSQEREDAELLMFHRARTPEASIPQLDSSFWKRIGEWVQTVIDKIRGKDKPTPTPDPVTPPVTNAPPPVVTPPTTNAPAPAGYIDPATLRAGFLWKPVSESRGKLVVILPEKLTAAGTYARLRVDPAGTVVEEPELVAIANGNRKHAYMPKRGDAYPAGIWATSDAGNYRYCWQVPNPGSRYDGQITPKRIEVPE